MPKRKNLSERQVHALPRRAKSHHVTDPQLMGHVLRVPKRGARAPVRYFAVAPLGRGGRQVWTVVGNSQTHSIEEAREIARAILRRTRAGLAAKETAPQSVAAVCLEWLEKVVVAGGFKSADERARIIRKYIVPRVGDMPITAVKRSDVIRLLEKVATDHGPAQAAQVRKVLAAVANWHANRADEFSAAPFANIKVAPLVARDRILTDDEIRTLWTVAERHQPVGDFLRFALLCGQRYQKIAEMRWDDLQDDVWLMRRGQREKGVGGALRLPPAALEIIERQPRVVGQDAIFGAVHYRAITALRADCGFEQLFTPHDLRRTFRSLLSRLQTNTEVAEACMGHVQGGVVGVYDRYDRFAEKGVALAKLAQLIQSIVEPAANNVVTLSGAAS